MVDERWFEPANFRLRSAEFGALREHPSGAAMELGSDATADPAGAARLWQLWRSLPPHPNVIQALDDGLVRYAALDWGHRPIALDADPGAPARAATWGVELVRVFEFVAARVDESELGHLASPTVKIDLEGEVRIVFAPTAGAAEAWRRLPPEVAAQWPRCDARGLVFVVGQALRSLIALDAAAETAAGAIVARCLAADPALRFATLAALRDALIAAGGQRKPTLGLRAARPVWDRLEAGLGFLALGSAAQALRCFEAALERAPRSARARVCRDEAAWRVRLPTGIALPWAEAAPIAARLVRDRAFREALVVYTTALPPGTDRLARDVAISGCCFQLGDHAHAVEHAERALGLAPDHAEAHGLRIESLVQLGRFAAALAAADAWIAAAPADGRAHHARGKSLLGLGRLPEARDAFDRACAASPELIAAMSMRREVDRSMAGTRATAGAAAAMSLDLPDHLAELRDVLADGRLQEAIERLQRAGHAHDGVAQLLLGHLLAFAGRPADALEVFDGAAGFPAHVDAARLGQANALLALDRAAEALAVFERVAGEHAEMGDAIEGCVRALQRLGREADADAALADYVALTARGSDLRVWAARHLRPRS